jgi:hypothetical protein
MAAERIYGTSGGIPITDALIDELVAEAERGYDPLTMRPLGRPALGSGPSAVVQVRVDPALGDALAARAADDATTASEIVRRALRAYLDVA